MNAALEALQASLEEMNKKAEGVPAETGRAQA
jgi:hypothetical protein